MEPPLDDAVLGAFVNFELDNCDIETATLNSLRCTLEDKLGISLTEVCRSAYIIVIKHSKIFY